MDNLFSLMQGAVGKKYFVKALTSSSKIKRRLLELGFVNTYVTILKKSKSVCLVELRHFVLALKSCEVASIMVEK